MRKLDDWEKAASVLSTVAILSLIVGCVVGYFLYPLFNETDDKSEDASIIEEAHHVVRACNNTLEELTSNMVVISLDKDVNKSVEGMKKGVKQHSKIEEHNKDLIKDKLKDNLHNKFRFNFKDSSISLL